MSSKRKSCTDIDSKSRNEVHERDGFRCVYCGKTNKPIELAHFIGRAQGGLGMPHNLVSLCIGCHHDYDGEKRNEIRPYLEEYLKSCYSGWNENELIYQKEYNK